MPSYFNNPRSDVLSFLESRFQAAQGIGNVLEIGCSDGSFAYELSQCFSIKSWTGIEPYAPSLEHDNKYHLLGPVIPLPVEHAIPAISKSKFDFIFALDVLEHLKDPYKILQDLSTLSTPNTNLVVSLPNISNYTIIHALISGKFEYTEHGILDQTHLRFFTPSSFKRAALSAGWSVNQVDPINSFAGFKSTIFSLLRTILPGFSSRFLAYGHIYLLQPTNTEK